MNGLGKAFAYLIAAHVQALAIISMAWWLGGWLNGHYPLGFNWLIVSIPFGVVAIAHTFYTIVRNLMKQRRSSPSSDHREG